LKQRYSPARRGDVSPQETLEPPAYRKIPVKNFLKKIFKKELNSRVRYLTKKIAPS
jgi:hypothetical protein